MKRRSFLQTGSVYVLGSTMLPSALKAAGKPAPSDAIRIGAIGINGMGWADLKAMLKVPGTQCVALCDVDKSVLDTRAAEVSKNYAAQPTLYNDYRKLLEDKNIDAVIIGTPDHWHCNMLADACAASKDVYVEKPAGNSIAECRAMVAAQQKYNRIVQVGQWQRSQKHFSDAVAFVHSGKLGQVRLVKVWAYQGWMKSIPVKPDSTPPPGVDYDLWLGPAQKRAFNPNRFHFNFRWYWDYAGGLMTDWGVHLVDYALLGMKAPLPKSVMAAGGKFAYPDDAEETPDTLTTVYEFDGFNMLWEHATGINGGPYGRDHGIAFIGNNGTLVLDRGGWEVIPEKDNGKEKMEAVARQKSVDNGLELHTLNFTECMKSRNTENLKTPIHSGAHVATVCQMGNIAFKTGKKIYWDAAAGKFTDADANKYMKAEYHNGYKMAMS